MSRFFARALLILLVAGGAGSVFIDPGPVPNALAVSPAGPDRKPPTAPSNLRVTGTTTNFRVSLAWNPSTDNSGSFSYRVHHSRGPELTVSQTETSLTWTANLVPGQSSSFYVFAIDAAGNKSKNSNMVTVAIPADPLPLPAPVISVTEIGVTHITLTWSRSGGSPTLRYLIFKDDVQFDQATALTSRTFYLLKPETTYTFRIQAKDGVNVSPFSDPALVTTKPRNPDDITPPTMPGSLHQDHYEGDREVNLSWIQSVDDFDPQRIIRYDVYVNGVLEDIQIGSGHSLIYGVFGENTIMVIAEDTAGNRSTAAIITFTI